MLVTLLGIQLSVAPVLKESSFGAKASVKLPFGRLAARVTEAQEFKPDASWQVRDPTVSLRLVVDF